MVIGATGTIGGAVARELGHRHEVVEVSRSGRVRVDMADPVSVGALFDRVGEVDAVVCCAASGRMTPLDAPEDALYWGGFDAKLVGQVNLVRRAVHQVRDGGSVTLTSGRFAEPVAGGSLGHMINTGLEAFVRFAAVEMPREVRLNAVSPGWVSETLESLGRDPAAGTPAAEVAKLYARAVEGNAHGRILTVGDGGDGTS